MPIVKQLLSTSAGELSPRLSYRNDWEKYDSGCRVLENFISTPQGAAIRRPGTEWIMDCPDTTTRTKGRLVVMQLSREHHVVLVLGGGVGRVIKNRVLQKTTTGEPVEFPIPWSDDELAAVSFRQVNSVIFCAHSAHQPHRIMRISDTDWVSEPIDFGTDSQMLPVSLDRELVMTVANADYGTPVEWAAGTIYAAGERCTFSGITYIAQASHDARTGTLHGPPPGGVYNKLVGGADGGTLVEAPLWGVVDGTTQVPALASVEVTASFDAFKAGHVGSMWRFDFPRFVPELTLPLTHAANGHYSDAMEVSGAWNLSTFGSWFGTVQLQISYDNWATYEIVKSYLSTTSVPRNVSVGGETSGPGLARLRFDVYPYAPDGAAAPYNGAPYALLTCSGPFLSGFVKVTEVVSARVAKGVAIGALKTGPTSRWAEGAWSPEQGFPSCVEMHQSRILFAGTKKNPGGIFGSAVDDYFNFSGGTKASDSFAHYIATGERDPILWMISDKHLFVGTGGSEYVVTGANESSPITPEGRNARRISQMGTEENGIRAIATESVPLFIQRGGDRILEIGYNFDQDRFLSANLCLTADHIHRGKTIVDMALMKVPFQILWCVDSAGQLSAHTYERSQQVAGWHRHPSAGAAFVAVATCRGDTGEDHVYFMVRRNGRLSVEVLAREIISQSPGGVWLDGTMKSTGGTFEGFERLSGQRVTVLLGGAEFAMDWSGAGALAGFGWFVETTASWGGAYYLTGEQNGKARFVRREADDEIVFSDGFYEISSGGAVVAKIPEADFVTGYSIIAEDGITFIAMISAITDSPSSLGRCIQFGYFGVFYPIASVSGRPVYRDPVHKWVLRYQEAGPYTGWNIESYSGFVLYKPTTPSGGSLPPIGLMWRPFPFTGVAPNAGPMTWIGDPQSDTIQVGFPYRAIYDPMPIQLPMGNGTSRSRELRIHGIVPDLENAWGGKFGPSLDALMPIGSYAAGFTGEVELSLDGGYGLSPDLFVVADAPKPFILRGLAVKLNVHGN